MSESAKTRLQRWGINLWPAVRGTGGWITYIASDWREVHVKVPFNLKTRNFVGTIFGGSMFAALDPFFMGIFVQNLGKEYIVWDRSGKIDYLKPGRSTLYAKFHIDESEIESIKAELQEKTKMERDYAVELVDKDGVVHARVEKTIYFRKKSEKLLRRT